MDGQGRHDGSAIGQDRAHDALRRRILRAALALHRRLGGQGHLRVQDALGWAPRLDERHQRGRPREGDFCVKCPSILSWLSFPSGAVTAVSQTCRPKINSFDPPLPAVSSAYPTEPLLSVFHPPIELPSSAPGSGLHLNRRVDFPAIRFGTSLQVVVAEVHI